jgi:ribosome-associated toxin RatA of RatAB toxin-antitoxin module
MRTVDAVAIAAAPDRVFAAARDVEQWPRILPHYRWVRFLERAADGAGGVAGGVVEMAAWRPFGPAPLRWPTWWVSEMRVEPATRTIRYRHVRGITRGMQVAWRLSPADGGTRVEIVHEWDGPAWPLVRRPVANLVIGPVFVHGIASRTLAGIKRYTEGRGGGAA